MYSELSDIRVEKHIIKSSSVYFKLLMDFCYKSKNLYNHATYLVRQEFISNGMWLRYSDLEKSLRSDTEYSDYKKMPTARTAQQVLRMVDTNWLSFFRLIKDWSNDHSKYHGKPHMPNYIKGHRANILILTNQDCKFRNNCIYFPKVFNGFIIKPKFIERGDFVSFQQVRFIPHMDRIVVEVAYKIGLCANRGDNNRYIGIDIGVDNLATIANNFGGIPIIINGKPLKSINQFYNKQYAHYKEVCKRVNGAEYSNRLSVLTEKRNAKINDYLHKASRKIINYCIDNQINTIIIGQNKNWKQKSKLGKVNNQNFVQIPFAKFIKMIQYKANEYGITVILTEESYTSGTSFIDNELPIRENYNKTRRIKRGLFKCNNGMVMNADLNGAYQIIKKVFPIKWDRGCALHPVMVNIT